MIEANVRFLEQGADLVRSIDDEAFPRLSVAYLAGTLGAHLRHVLDHYDALLDGLAAGRIDYDDRERDADVERDRRACLGRFESAIARLRALGPDETAPDRPVSVRVESGAWTASTLGREWQFLLGHTVHHYAYVAALLKAQRVAVPDDFGVAPSTLRYRAAVRT